MRQLRFLLLASLLLAAMPAASIAQNAVAVYQKDGKMAKFAFTEKPVVTYSGDELVLTTSKTTVQYPINMLRKLAFDVDELIDDVDEVTLPQTLFGFRDGKLTISGGEASGTVSLYAMNGTAVGQFRLDSDGHATIPLHHLGSGLYIIKTKQFSFKFRMP